MTDTGRPSPTARVAAAHRAVHQLLDGGRLFRDPLAAAILGEDPDELVRAAQAVPSSALMRRFIAARARIAEDALGAAVVRGTRQLVVLGAGLDTFAYRNPYAAAGLAVIEVDHPATQAWKRARLAAAGIAEPPGLTFAPVDLERQRLADGLAAAGLDAARPAFFTWLGVVPYLSEAAVFDTLRYIGGLAAGTQVVFDYADPPATLAPAHRSLHEARAGRVAALGEPWVTFFSPVDLAARLTALGLSEIEDLGPGDIAERYLGMPAIVAPATGGHVIRATRP
jgi:methyltransferase (TIGR00027 family)